MTADSTQILASSKAHRAPAPRTPEEIRQKAREQFGWFAQLPNGFGDRTREDCQTEAHYGTLLVEEALALEAGQVLDLEAWQAKHGIAEDDNAKRRVFNALGHMTYLRLLRMEYAHPDIGDVPGSEIREMFQVGLNTDQPRMYKGVALTPDTIIIQYRRLPL